ncbi:MAG TPA: hypothetical protein VFX88_25335 [Actinomycetota bacterium]|nr:hypothetical protein [Actinomycetota bacterium]
MQAFVAVGLGIAVLPSLALVFMRPGLHRVRLTAPLVRHITAARLAASYRSAATGSMLSILKETADAFVAPPPRPAPDATSGRGARRPRTGAGWAAGSV